MYSRGQSDRIVVLEPAYVRLAERLRCAFLECPSLALTAWQAADWLELDDVVTVRVLEALAAEGTIERGKDDRYRLLLKH